MANIFKILDKGSRSERVKKRLSNEPKEDIYKGGYVDTQELARRKLERDVLEKSKQLKKEAREKAFKAAKETVKKIAKYIPRNQKTQPAKGLSEMGKVKKVKENKFRQRVSRDTGESYAMPTQEPWHREMLAPRDNGYRPHVPKSLVVEPDVEGYSRNLLLQPYKNIWDEPRKPNVWDETFKKKKSVFE